MIASTPLPGAPRLTARQAMLTEALQRATTIRTVVDTYGTSIDALRSLVWVMVKQGQLRAVGKQGQAIEYLVPRDAKGDPPPSVMKALVGGGAGSRPPAAPRSKHVFDQHPPRQTIRPQGRDASPPPTLAELLPVERPNPMDARLEPGVLVPVPESARYRLPSYDLYIRAMCSPGLV